MKSHWLGLSLAVSQLSRKNLFHANLTKHMHLHNLDTRVIRPLWPFSVSRDVTQAGVGSGGKHLESLTARSRAKNELGHAWVKEQVAT